MTRALLDATSRACAALPAVSGAVIAVLLPSLLMGTSDVTGSVACGALALAVLAFVRVGLRGTVLVARTSATDCPTGAEATPVLPGRVTDPVHHPLRPRAPGLS